jgi:EAL and modified HD-GYP domain-containing signal transduction protein
MGNLTNGKRAFINFTERLLLEETALLLPKDIVVIEILETVSPTEKLIECCKKLKSLGYTLALDDFVFKEEYESLIDLADYIKVDFRITTGSERKRVINRVKNKNVKFLAEKVETMEEFNEAVKMGYSYFQGFFFSKPTIVSAKEMPSSTLNNFELFRYINLDNYELSSIENIIKKDVSLSYKLLKYINSASFGVRTRIHSIKQALVFMGKLEFMKWATLVTLRNFNDSNNEAILDTSIVRARFGETIALKADLETRASDVFIMGMFSDIDVLLSQPMEKALLDIPISEDIKAALLGEENIFFYIKQLIISYEKADWDSFSFHAKLLGIKEEEVPVLYKDAVIWSAQMMQD